MDKLHAEHEVIAGVLARTDQAMVAFVTDPSSIGKVRRVVDELTDVLLSHFSYEEQELFGPLGEHPVLS